MSGFVIAIVVIVAIVIVSSKLPEDWRNAVKRWLLANSRPLAIGGFILCLVAGVLFIDWKIWMETNAVTTTGRVLASEFHQGKGDSSSWVSVTVEFATEDGALKSDKLSCEGGPCLSSKVGDKIPIIYPRGSPESVHPDTFTDRWAISLEFLVTLVALGWFSLWIATKPSPQHSPDPPA